MNILPVIMSGGAGTRLWPMSRAKRPKQFLSLVSERTLFQDTILRCAPPSDERFLPPAIIAGAGHGAIVQDQLEEIGVDPRAVILEPFGRNTAAVAAVASALAAEAEEDPLILLTPADHKIADPEAFRRAVIDAAPAAADGYIVTFGIKPDHPHTGYGYIEAGAPIAGDIVAVARFQEKPDAETAARYLAKGGFFWNAGIFLFQASAMMDELDHHAPLIGEAARNALAKSRRTGGARRLDETAFSTCPEDSIDYAVMEKTDKAAMIAPVDVGWSDIGSWSEARSAVNGAELIELDAADNVIRSEGVSVAAIGVENLIIVATPDAVLVAPRDEAQRVREIVTALKARGRVDLL